MCVMVGLYAVYKILDWVFKFMMVMGSKVSEMSQNNFAHSKVGSVGS